jgi:hypothetical protein
MVLIVMKSYRKRRTTLFDPCGTLAPIGRDQTLDIPDAIAFGNDTRLRKHTWCQLPERPGSFGHGVRVPLGPFYPQQPLCSCFFVPK